MYMNVALTRLALEEEIKVVAHQMRGMKASELDGFQGFSSTRSGGQLLKR